MHVDGVLTDISNDFLIFLSSISAWTFVSLFVVLMCSTSCDSSHDTLSINKWRNKLTWDAVRLLECTHNNKYTNMMCLNVESVATAAVVFVWTCSLSSANIQSAQTNFTRGIKVATRYMKLKSYSKIKCVEKCFDEKRHGRCSIAGYNLATVQRFMRPWVKYWFPIDNYEKEWPSPVIYDCGQ